MTPLDRWKRCKELTGNEGLSAAEAAILDAVAFHDGGKGCTASVATLGRGSGYKDRTCRKALKLLVRRGLIRVKEHRPGRTSVYVLSEFFYGDV